MASNHHRTWTGVSRLLRAPIDPWTYRALGYVLLSMPLAIVYLVVLTAGFAVSIGTMVVLVGPAVLGVTLLVVVAFGRLEGVLAEALLSADVQSNLPRTDTLVTFLEDLFLSRETWLSVLLLCWKVVLGFFALVVVLSGFALAWGLLSAAVWPGEWTVLRMGSSTVPVDSTARAVAAGVGGLGVVWLLFVLLHLLGLLSRRVATALFATVE